MKEPASNVPKLLAADATMLGIVCLIAVLSTRGTIIALTAGTSALLFGLAWLHRVGERNAAAKRAAASKRTAVADLRPRRPGDLADLRAGELAVLGTLQQLTAIGVLRGRIHVGYSNPNACVLHVRNENGHPGRPVVGIVDSEYAFAGSNQVELDAKVAELLDRWSDASDEGVRRAIAAAGGVDLVTLCHRANVTMFPYEGVPGCTTAAIKVQYAD